MRPGAFLPLPKAAVVWEGAKQFSFATVISLRLATRCSLSKDTPQVILQAKARSLYPHTRPIGSTIG